MRERLVPFLTRTLPSTAYFLTYQDSLTDSKRIDIISALIISVSVGISGQDSVAKLQFSRRKYSIATCAKTYDIVNVPLELISPLRRCDTLLLRYDNRCVTLLLK